MDESTRKSISYLVNEIRNNPDDDIVEIFEEAFCGEGLVSEWVDETPYEIEIRIVGEQHIQYHKYEFCRAIDCCNFNNGKCDHEGKRPNICSMTAKEYHQWLTKNGFEIVRLEG